MTALGLLRIPKKCEGESEGGGEGGSTAPMPVKFEISEIVRPHQVGEAQVKQAQGSCYLLRIPLRIFWVIIKSDLVIIKTDPIINKTDPVINKTDPIINKTGPVINKTDPVINKTAKYCLAYCSKLINIPA